MGAQFDGGAITSDGGGLLLREVEKRVGILRQFSACFTDYRNPDLIEHTVEELGVWCSWRFVISLSTGHVTMFRWLYIVHFKGTLNSGEAQGESDTATLEQRAVGLLVSDF
ncbi:MAG: transposase [Candidatus Acidiferrum sp.]